VLVAALEDLADALLLLRRREVRREEVDLQLAVAVELVRELVELLLEDVELVVVLADLEQRTGVDRGDLLHLRTAPVAAAASGRATAGQP
jgi:hypothetical protein